MDELCHILEAEQNVCGILTSDRMEKVTNHLKCDKLLREMKSQMKIIKKDAALNAQPLVSNVNVCTCEIGYKRSFLLVVVVTY